MIPYRIIAFTDGRPLLETSVYATQPLHHYVIPTRVARRSARAISRSNTPGEDIQRPHLKLHPSSSDLNDDLGLSSQDPPPKPLDQLAQDGALARLPRSLAERDGVLGRLSDALHLRTTLERCVKSLDTEEDRE